MPPRCSICFHNNRETIDELLLAKTSQLRIAEQFNLSPDAVFRHNKQHLHLPMAKAAEKALAGRRPTPKARLERAQNAIEIARGSDLLAQMGKLVEDAERIKRRAEENLDLRTALQGVRELCRLIELAGRLTGQLASGSTVNVGLAGGGGMNGPLTIAMFDEILREEEERTGSNDIEAVFRRETSGFIAADFAWLWERCRERTQKRIALLLDAAPAPDLHSDDAQEPSEAR